MADKIVSKRRVAPMPGAIVRNIIASGAGSVGDVIGINADMGGRVANAGAAPTANAHGVVTAVGCEGAVDFEVGDALSVVTHGPVCGITNGAPGAVYLSNADGKMADAAGTVSRVIGRVESADIVYVNIQAA